MGFTFFSAATTSPGLFEKITGSISFGLYALAALATLIVVHEFGHFIVARLLDVRVEKFSVGFGKKIISKKWRDVEYILAWIPLGGYVKFYGDEIEEDGEDDPDHFLNQAVWKRLLIVAAGPFFNIVLAIVIMAGVALWGVPSPTLDIEYIRENGAAEKAGLMVGDKIVFINGVQATEWSHLEDALSLPGHSSVEVEVSRNDKQLTLNLAPDKIGKIGVEFKVEKEEGTAPVVRRLFPDGAAYSAGVLPKDVLVAIDGVTDQTLKTAVETIRNSADKEVILTMKRGSETVELPITPKPVPDIGFAPKIEIKQYGLFGALEFGVVKSWTLTLFIFDSLKKLISREIPANQLAGPIGILQIAGEAAEDGIYNLLHLLALISINLGILNLLPIPVLDGGHIIFFSLEALMGRPLHIKMQEIAQQIGVALLVSLMIFAFYNDLMRIFT